jgi:CheY-like chemotaxis protein
MRMTRRIEARRAGRRATVLVVGSDPDLRDMARVLVRKGLSVRFADDGASACCALSAGFDPGLVLLDVEMTHFGPLFPTLRTSRFLDVAVAIVSPFDDEDCPEDRLFFLRKLDMQALFRIVRATTTTARPLHRVRSTSGAQPSTRAVRVRVLDRTRRRPGGDAAAPARRRSRSRLARTPPASRPS